MTRYRILGLCVDSDLPLAGDVEPDLAASVDVTLSYEREAPIPAMAAPGQVLSQLTDPHGALLSATTRLADGSIKLRICGAIEFTMDVESGRIGYALDPLLPPGMAEIFAGGMCLSTYLTVLGKSLLHASAVYVPELDGVVAFVGSSGMGKSTIATLLAGDGYALVCDDVLRLERRDHGFECQGGGAQPRLRPKAAGLADSFDFVRRTADARVAVTTAVHDQPGALLRAIVIPGPVRDNESVVLNRVTGIAAVQALLLHPRLPGWRDVDAHQRQFSLLCDLVDHLPVMTSKLPWGPPFPRSTARDLLIAIRTEVQGHTVS